MPQHEPLQLLLIEDNPGDVRLTQEALKEIPLSIQLSVVEDGESALAFLRREKLYTHAPHPDFILLDLHLPRKEGVEVLAEIKRDRALRRIPVAVCLGLAEEQVRVAPHQLLEDCIIIKSIDAEQLIKALTHCRAAA